MVGMRPHDSLWSVFKAAKKSLAAFFYWAESAAIVVQNQLRQAMKNVIKEYTPSGVAIV